jgi:hypothetical protein
MNCWVGWDVGCLRIVGPGVERLLVREWENGVGEGKGRLFGICRNICF